MSEKDMYDRHPSIKSIKSIASITITTRRVVSIYFYRLIDTIDNVYVIDIDSYRFIERFSDIDFYRLPTSALHEDRYLNLTDVTYGNAFMFNTAVSRELCFSATPFFFSGEKETFRFTWCK